MVLPMQKRAPWNMHHGSPWTHGVYHDVLPWFSPWCTMEHAIDESMVPITPVSASYRVHWSTHKTIASMVYAPWSPMARSVENSMAAPHGACTIGHRVKRNRPWGVPWYMFMVTFMGHPTDDPVDHALDAPGGVPIVARGTCHGLLIGYSMGEPIGHTMTIQHTMGDAITSWHI